jgi:hypothetical protein
MQLLAVLVGDNEALGGPPDGDAATVVEPVMVRA